MRYIFEIRLNYELDVTCLVVVYVQVVWWIRKKLLLKWRKKLFCNLRSVIVIQ